MARDILLQCVAAKPELMQLTPTVLLLDQITRGICPELTVVLPSSHSSQLPIMRFLGQASLPPSFPACTEPPVLEFQVNMMPGVDVNAFGKSLGLGAADPNTSNNSSAIDDVDDSSSVQSTELSRLPFVEFKRMALRFVPPIPSVTFDSTASDTFLTDPFPFVWRADDGAACSVHPSSILSTNNNDSFLVTTAKKPGVKVKSHSQPSSNNGKASCVAFHVPAQASTNSITSLPLSLSSSFQIPHKAPARVSVVKTASVPTHPPIATSLASSNTTRAMQPKLGLSQPQVSTTNDDSCVRLGDNGVIFPSHRTVVNPRRSSRAKAAEQRAKTNSTVSSFQSVDAVK